MRYNNYKKNYRNNYYKKNNNYYRQNKYDKFNSIEKITEKIFQPNDKFLLSTPIDESVKIESLNKDALPYYPLPSNEGYEIFLQVSKKEIYKKTQYSLPFMLSLRDKYKDPPDNMKEIKIPQKNEIRSRAKVVTEEAYRVTRNYLDENSDRRNFSISYVKKNEISDMELKNKIMMLREILNKISLDKNEDLINEILKFDYDEKLLNSFKNLIINKILTENLYFDLYVKICLQICKLYNKKTYSNEPNMNFKKLLLTSIQEEFLKPKETSIAFPINCKENEESKNKFIKKIKYANIDLISEFYVNKLFSKKIIRDCIEELINKNNNFSISLLCHLLMKTANKLYTDENNSFTKAFTFLEKLNLDDNKEISMQTKIEILETLEQKEKVINTDYTNLRATPLSQNLINNTIISLRKNSEVKQSRKSSINPKDVEYIKRSRFNSKADELRTLKDDNPNLVEEVLKYLNMDIEFYQCFQLNEEECNIVKDYCDKFLLNELADMIGDKKNSNIEKNFEEMMEELQCEKFIAIGHLIEIMFSQTENNAKKIIQIIIYLFRNKLIFDEDIKHGIVLGLVKFKNNLANNPNTKKYFQNFIDEIKLNKILDEKILNVYQKCCNGIGEKFE
jgi:hypothetical protein